MVVITQYFELVLCVHFTHKLLFLDDTNNYICQLRVIF